jgi:hypothetical protein
MIDRIKYKVAYIWTIYAALAKPLYDVNTRATWHAQGPHSNLAFMVIQSSSFDPSYAPKGKHLCAFIWQGNYDDLTNLFEAGDAMVKKEFQKMKGLKVDGKVGPMTWGELQKYLNVQPSAPAGKAKR